jgi:hypothetical protein
MPDITQAATGEGVTFTANTNPADVWMRQTYGDHTVTFHFPEQHSEAVSFREAAKAAGFSIKPL